MQIRSEDSTNLEDWRYANVTNLHLAENNSANRTRLWRSVCIFHAKVVDCNKLVTIVDIAYANPYNPIIARFSARRSLCPFLFLRRSRGVGPVLRPFLRRLRRRSPLRGPAFRGPVRPVRCPSAPASVRCALRRPLPALACPRVRPSASRPVAPPAVSSLLPRGPLRGVGFGCVVPVALASSCCSRPRCVLCGPMSRLSFCRRVSSLVVCLGVRAFFFALPP
jgi:hypothetical protein